MSPNLENITDIPAYIFGAESTLASHEVLFSTHREVSYLLAVVAFAIAALYLMWLNYWSAHGDNHRSIFRYLGFHRGDYSSKLEQITPSFKPYLISGSVFCVIMAWLGIISYTGLLSSGSYHICGAILLGIAALYMFQPIVATLLGLVLNDKEFTNILIHLNGIRSTIASLVLTPIVLCYSIANNKLHEFLFYLLIIQLVALILLFIYETFILFLSKKVSVLHTILYLCTVEIFPITLIWGIFYR